MSICVACSKQFTPKPKTAGKYCSQICYQAQPKKVTPLADRFWSYVDKGPDCWLWNGCNDGDDGYGRIKLGRRNIGSHRASWLIHFGEIPDGLQVCHTCDNPPCVRPEHLFLGTNRENSLDCVNKGRNKPPDNRGSRSGVSKLTEADVIAIRAAYTPQKHGSKAKLAEHFGISIGTLSAIIWRRRWKHI